MAATVTLRVNTSTNAGTESGAVTGIDLISADNATNSLANRQANPVSVSTNSFEKWMTLKIDAVPDNYIENVQAWLTGTPDANLTLNVGTTDTGATPTASASSVATTDFTTHGVGNKLSWHSGQLSSLNATTDFLVVQLVVGASASPGNMTQLTINYSYDEA